MNYPCDRRWIGPSDDAGTMDPPMHLVCVRRTATLNPQHHIHIGIIENDPTPVTPFRLVYWTSEVPSLLYDARTDLPYREAKGPERPYPCVYHAQCPQPTVCLTGCRGPEGAVPGA